MESLGYYSNDTQIKATLDTKFLQRQVDVESKIKEAYGLLLGTNQDFKPEIRDVKVLFFGLNNVWQPWMSSSH
jgi:hypothetical protein